MSRYEADCGKRRYPSVEAAERELLWCWSKSMAGNRRRRECNAYPCATCGGWHLTSRREVRL